MNNILKLSILLSILLSFFVSTLESQETGKADEYFERCMDGINHKTEPGPEDNLHQQCSPWSQKSCCTDETSRRAHVENMYNFNWDHCSQKKPMSPKCREHFTQDLCFYECSPNVGPWLTPVKQKIRNERFVNVPLCASDCNAWFDACKDDFTCTSNWGRNFDWVPSRNSSIQGKVNQCPQDGKCDTFKNVFQTPEFFCENVWDHSWKYTPDEAPGGCMRIWFDGENGNPNDAVAKYHFKRVKSNSDVAKASCFGVFTTITLLVVAQL